MNIAANSDNAPDPEFGTIPSLLTKLAKSDDSSAIAIAESLSSLNQIAIKRFNSLTHGGRYPVVHALVGPRPEDLAWMIRTTSSLSYIAAQLYVRLAGYVASSNELLAVRNNFKDCMHSAS